jgi:hypothetical protein
MLDGRTIPTRLAGPAVEGHDAQRGQGFLMRGLSRTAGRSAAVRFWNLNPWLTRVEQVVDRNPSRLRVVVTCWPSTSTS